MKTLFIGHEFYELPELASTNSYALDLLSKSNPSEGTVILTYKQTAGRGQIGSKWESEPDKNVSMSIILHPKFLPVQRQFDLNIIVALALYDVISSKTEMQSQSSAVKIKWPNDLYIRKKKIGGILIQNTLSGTNLQSSIIGIGLNVNQTEFISDAPNPTSLKIETKTDFSLPIIVWEICAALEKRYLQLRNGKNVLLRAEYLTKLYQIEKVATYQRTNGSYFTGIIRGISALGKLQIELENSYEEFGLKEVKFC